MAWRTRRVSGPFGTLAAAAAVAIPVSAMAKQNIRQAFFDVYPESIGSVIASVPSHPDHCGVCHWNFGGGGPRNPYGQLLESELGNWPNNPNGRRQAVMAIEDEDADDDDYATLVEVTDLDGFSNTPTFPGLTGDNVAGVQNVDLGDILDHLVPGSSGGDVTPPEVEILAPSGGLTLVANAESVIQWTATDESGIAFVNVLLSLDGGATFDPIAPGVSNEGVIPWFPANRPTTQAIVRVEAFDGAFNFGYEDTDAFSIESPPGGIVPSTLRDFDQPGTQPFEGGELNPPGACICHGFYDQAVEPRFNWQGSMMSQASSDPLFEALMTISNQDAPDSGDLCLRCHIARGWVDGRSVPTDGTQMLDTDKRGVACDLCHRLVDVIYEPGTSPPEDAGILDELTNPPSTFGNGMYVIDPTGTRRGPFEDADTGHPVLVSPFHREAALCGTCHDVSNPAFERDEQARYVPNAFDAPAEDFSATNLMPVERTYSEWLNSDYNSPEGVYAPQFGGNLEFVATCQDCHMRDVTGKGCVFEEAPVRDDLPLHDMTGGSTWLPGLMPSIDPGSDPASLAAGIERARFMLQNAAELSALQEEDELVVTVVNQTGHKLPTGYPEGRRMWINVAFYDDGMQRLAESGAYEPLTGVLTLDEQVKVYEIKLGVDETIAALLGVEPGPTFHFVLNNMVYKDNRIPPRGFANDAFATFGGAPVGHDYSDGQHWDDTIYAIPAGATYAEVTLFYQSVSKEFVEFLRDENVTDDRGQLVYDLWEQNGRCPPEAMAMVTVPLDPTTACPGDVDGNDAIDADDLVAIILAWGACEDPECPADVDGNGIVDVDDLLVVILGWGGC